MRILIVHNFYQRPGGEDQVFAAETELLERHGHSVTQYTVHNARIAELRLTTLIGKTFWNRSVYQELQALCRAERPEVVHFHNTFPLLSPAAYYAVRSEGAAVVQTLHNYRLLCPGSTLFRDGKVCEECISRSVAWPAVLHGCYRESRAASLGVATLVATHRMANTWMTAVDIYIALTNFAREKFIESGVPAAKLVHKPNFVTADPGVGEHRGGYALFVGRLTEEKGIQRLLNVWAQIGNQFPLKVAGDGPLAPLLREQIPGVEWLGHRSRNEVVDLMKNASFLIFPSEWYETFGLTIIEAFATGLPVIASDLGAASELVKHGYNGLNFRVGDTNDLLSSVLWALEHPEQLSMMGANARRDYLDRYTSEQNYRVLMDVYENAMRRRTPAVHAG